MDFLTYGKTRVKRTRFKDIVALEEYRWQNHLIYMKTIDPSWIDVFVYMRTNTPNIHNAHYLLGHYFKKLYLFELHDGLSYKSIKLPYPTPSPNATEQDILVTKAVDLPLYINIDLIDSSAKAMLHYRLHENVTDIPYNDDVVTNYFKICNRVQKIRRIGDTLTSILYNYIKDTHDQFCYSKDNEYHTFLFKLTLNGRDYFMRFSNREFKWVRLPEQECIDVPIIKDISNMYFQFPEGELEKYNRDDWCDERP